MNLKIDNTIAYFPHIPAYIHYVKAKSKGLL
jgi:hypothetical protein